MVSTSCDSHAPAPVLKAGDPQDSRIDEADQHGDVTRSSTTKLNKLEPWIKKCLRDGEITLGTKSNSVSIHVYGLSLFLSALETLNSVCLW